MNTFLRRAPRPARPLHEAPVDLPEIELPSAVMKVLDAARLHQRTSTEAGERFAVVLALPQAPAFMSDSPGLAVRALEQGFPGLSADQVEAAGEYLMRVIRQRKRELLRAARPANWVNNW